MVCLESEITKIVIVQVSMDMTVPERAGVTDLTCTTVYESDINELKCKILD